jgi:hypothetical protein
VLRSVQNTSADATGGSNLRVQVLSLPDKLLTNRLVAQTAAQPGLLTVWLNLLTPDATSTNFVCMHLPPDMEQMTYQDIRRWADAQGPLHCTSMQCIVVEGSVRELAAGTICVGWCHCACGFEHVRCMLIKAIIKACYLDVAAPGQVAACCLCRSFSDDVVLGYIDRGGVQLNPSDRCTPGPGSKLVLLTDGSECDAGRTEQTHGHSTTAAWNA